MKIVYTMLKNITFSAEEELITKAREVARENKTTLNAVFRRWLKQYAERKKRSEEYDSVMEKVNYVRAGRKFTRDEMNER
jgi:N-methylhydantoinase A/oxoprolinase/acetone carboxylase beta subunit